jgi:hypothetical protein
VVAATETSEAVQDKAEATRRQVIYDAFVANVDACAAIHKKWMPDDYQPRDDFCPEILELIELAHQVEHELDLAIDCHDHDHAFKLTSWFYDESVYWHHFSEQLAAKCEAAGLTPARP